MNSSENQVFAVDFFCPDLWIKRIEWAYAISKSPTGPNFWKIFLSCASYINCGRNITVIVFTEQQLVTLQKRLDQIKNEDNVDLYNDLIQFCSLIYNSSENNYIDVSDAPPYLIAMNFPIYMTPAHKYMEPIEMRILKPLDNRDDDYIFNKEKQNKKFRDYSCIPFDKQRYHFNNITGKIRKIINKLLGVDMQINKVNNRPWFAYFSNKTIPITNEDVELCEAIKLEPACIKAIRNTQI